MIVVPFFKFFMSWVVKIPSNSVSVYMYFFLMCLFVKEHKLEGKAEMLSGRLALTLTGHGAHASAPETGRNAATYLALFLDSDTVVVDPFHGAFQLGQFMVMGGK